MRSSTRARRRNYPSAVADVDRGSGCDELGAAALDPGCEARRKNTRGSRSRSLLRDTRGSVTAEGVIVIFFFVMVFTFLAYEGKRYKTLINLKRDARQQGWEFALPGCGEADRDLNLLPFIDQVDPAGCGPACGSGPSCYQCVRRAVPLRGSFFDSVIAPQIIASDNRSVSRPTSLGGGVRDFNVRFVTSCNEVVRDTRSGLEAVMVASLCRTGVCPPPPDPACADSTDNDGDGYTDYPSDPDCSSPSDDNESASCSDGVDNDGDGYTDFPNDPECIAPEDSREDRRPDCIDFMDNDGDGNTDYPSDPDCSSNLDYSES